jgi:hypothetical protein
MSTFDRSPLTCCAALALAFFVLSPLPARAQQPVDAPRAPAFLSRYDFHLSAATLSSDDTRFSWDTHFGGEVDAVDYVIGRTSAIMDYQAVLGSQLRVFDPNQGNYTLEVSSSLRFGGVEVAGMLHHVSRHLSDRPKTLAIAWNILGARVLNHTTRGATTIDSYADLGRISQKAYVDYAWTGNADVKVRRQLRPLVAVYADATAHLIGIDSARSARDAQKGGTLEGGVRWGGTEGVAELYAGYERRVDADPLDFQPQRWAFVGFRLVRR